MRKEVAEEMGSYQKRAFDMQIESATPHRLVSMMFEGATARVVKAKSAIDTGKPVLKREMISQAIAIVDALRESLNLDDGGDLAANLKMLYLYVVERLTMADARNSMEMLDECNNLLLQVSGAWEQIPVEIHAANHNDLRDYAVV